MHRPRHQDTPSPLSGEKATGSALSPDARRVELVWNDPVSGQRLSVGLDASDDLVDRLRADGFVVVEAAGPSDGGDGDSTAAA
ncbi:MAG: hypothetical protein AAF726_03480 [Planctomycetota bacterium]